MRKVTPNPITPTLIKPVEKNLVNKKVLGRTATKARIEYIDLNESIVVFELIEVVGTGVDAVENVLASDRYIKLSALPFTLTAAQKTKLAERVPVINRKIRKQRLGDGTKITDI